ncbi:DegV family protein [Bombilactobacillus thymidiniphilus]|uniref:DegV family protein n=1 Tax=Bombilactobacillus thymidiniphilus TaxID=2923363 RepID=A0ABY4PDC2_9LACO|nr:DegV family protein [Bombilactobacillus thymidiniphilus]UQS83711.1 DegV family protein [Bombilactobacillus thymidiniphilus]
MTNVKIVTDSSIQMTPEEVEKYHVTIIPLTVEIDGQQYIDGQDITRAEFSQKMLSSTDLPKTSQPPLGRFVDVFNELGQDGSPILAIMMTKGLSGTADAASQAADLVDSKVTVVDSGFTDRGLAFQVIAAAKMAQAGASINDILLEIQKIRDKTELYVAVPNLENLLKGGRLGNVASSLTTLLNINVVVQLADSKLKVVKKGRGIKTINKFVDGIVEEIAADGAQIDELGMAYVNDATIPNEIAARLHQDWPELNTVIELTSPIIMTHTGKGAFAMIFYRK